MTVEIRYTLLTPEYGVQRIAGAAPPPPPGPRPGMPAPPRNAPPPPPTAPMARRLDTLDNKTVYLVDTGFGGSYKFMQQLEKWFAAHIPSVKTVRRRKSGHVFADDNSDLWEEVKARGHAVVLGVAG